MEQRNNPTKIIIVTAVIIIIFVFIIIGIIIAYNSKIIIKMKYFKILLKILFKMMKKKI